MKKIRSNELKVTFKNGTIFLDETTGELMIREMLKDDEEITNLTEILNDLAGIEALNISISSKETEEE